MSSAWLVARHGIDGDAQAGVDFGHVSLLAEEHLDGPRARGVELPPGACCEHIVTRGLRWEAFELGGRFRIGPEAVLELVRRGKPCQTPCEMGGGLREDCLMPRLGVCAAVLAGGLIAPGDQVVVAPVSSKLRCLVISVGAPPRDTAVDVVREAPGYLPYATLDLPADEDLVRGHLERLGSEGTCDAVMLLGPARGHDVAARAMVGAAHELAATGRSRLFGRVGRMLVACFHESLVGDELRVGLVDARAWIAQRC